MSLQDVESCISPCSIVVKGQLRRQLLETQTFNWRPAYSFKGLIYDHHGGEHGDMALDQ